MWGWKTVERHVSPAVPLDQARVKLIEQGFEEQSGDSRYATFVREGTRLTTAGENMPVELALAETDSGLIAHVRYQAFVLFDTGDLEEFGDQVAEMLTAA